MLSGLPGQTRPGLANHLFQLLQELWARRPAEWREFAGRSILAGKIIMLWKRKGLVTQLDNYNLLWSECRA